MYSIVYILTISYILVQVRCENSGLKIINSSIATEDEYPFIVRLERIILLRHSNKIIAENNVHICTCVALSRSLSLTAGHCLDSIGFYKTLNRSLTVQTVIRYGSGGSKTAQVTSFIYHPSFYDPDVIVPGNIGLVRAELIDMKLFATLSAVDVNNLGNRVVTLVGYKDTTFSLRIGKRRAVKPSKLQLLRAVVVPLNVHNISPLPMTCEVNCLPTSMTCDGASGGPLLHSTEVVGISTISLKYIKDCSELNKNRSIKMGEIIDLMKPHLEWINDNMK